jgi:polar amino acid transport system permease protein
VTQQPVTGPAVVPVRHPWRWVSAGVITVLVAMFVHMLVTNAAFQWDFLLRQMFGRPVLHGALGTVELTVLSMLMGILGGVVLGVMRLSPSKLIAGVAWAYIWFFRAVPRLVLAILFGNFGILYPKFFLGIPFDHQLLSLFGLGDSNLRFFGIESRTIGAGFFAGVLALGLSEAAYMAEIVRAGILSIDPGQREAAASLGMGRMMTMRRIVLPQAMRVIIPPTGNETIAMLKDTSLVAFTPWAGELFFQLNAIGARTFQVFPLLVAACLWYLAISSVLMLGQFFLERRFA